ncbi:hypothetical protein GW17_00055274 [Ensete ventricosum]|nr:hypothetical protein GW17_00055274 [Ensete ventricosum]RZS16607.1 hypothetical protein BHM03_00048621 [Ensete ventricosum]
MYKYVLTFLSLGSTFKKKSPKAIKEIRKKMLVQKAMETPDVRVDVKLNKHIWSWGIRSVPSRVRVRIALKRNQRRGGCQRVLIGLMLEFFWILSLELIFVGIDLLKFYKGFLFQDFLYND